MPGGSGPGDHPSLAGRPPGGDPVVREAKQRLRESVLGMARQVDAAQLTTVSDRACNHLLGLRAVHLARTVALYSADDHEIDPAAAAAVLHDRGVRTLVPRVVDEELVLAPGDDPGLLVARGRGAPEPAIGTVPGDEVDVIVVPGIAFDLDGGRLGRGAGHYDRLLARMPNDSVRVGLAHGTQLVTRVPREPHDEVLDIIITGRGVHHSGARSPQRDA